MACLQATFAAALLAACAVASNIPLRIHQCRLLMDVAKDYDDHDVGLLCRSRLGLKDCNHVMDSLGGRPWQDKQVHAVCATHGERILGDTNMEDLLHQSLASFHKGTEGAIEFANATVGIVGMIIPLDATLEGKNVTLIEHVNGKLKNASIKVEDLTTKAAGSVESGSAMIDMLLEHAQKSADDLESLALHTQAVMDAHQGGLERMRSTLMESSDHITAATGEAVAATKEATGHAKMGLDHLIGSLRTIQDTLAALKKVEKEKEQEATTTEATPATAATATEAALPAADDHKAISAQAWMQTSSTGLQQHLKRANLLTVGVVVVNGMFALLLVSFLAWRRYQGRHLLPREEVELELVNELDSDEI